MFVQNQAFSQIKQFLNFEENLENQINWQRINLSIMNFVWLSVKYARILQHRCNRCEYASSHSVNLKRHLKPHSGEKSQKDFLAVQISIPVHSSVWMTSGEAIKHKLPLKNTELDVKLNSSLKTFQDCTSFGSQNKTTFNVTESFCSASMKLKSSITFLLSHQKTQRSLQAVCFVFVA